MNKFSKWRAEKKRIREINAEGWDGYDWNENQPKWPLTRILKVGFNTIAVIIWAIILLRIFTSGNNEYEKMILLNDSAAQIYPTQSAEVIRIHSATDEQEDGSVLIYYPVYLPEADNFQLTARVNTRTRPAGDGEIGYQFVLKETADGETKYYPLSYYAMEKTFQYRFYRLCFESVEWKENGTYTFLLFGEDFVPQTGEHPYSPSKAEFTFVVRNSDTYCNTTSPDEDIFRKESEMK